MSLKTDDSTIEVNVVFVALDDRRDRDNPLLHLSSTTTTTLKNLLFHRSLKRTQRNLLSPDDYHHYKWYNSMLRSEIRSAGDNYKMKLIHWDIDSGDEDLFLINGELFTDITIIFSADMEHWYCSNPNNDTQSIYGSHLRKAFRPKSRITEILEKRNQMLRPEPSSDLFEMSKIIYKMNVSNLAEDMSYYSFYNESQETAIALGHYHDPSRIEANDRDKKSNKRSERKSMRAHDDKQNQSQGGYDKFQIKKLRLYKVTQMLYQSLQIKLQNLKNRLLQTIKEEDSEQFL